MRKRVYALFVTALIGMACTGPTATGPREDPSPALSTVPSTSTTTLLATTTTAATSTTTTSTVPATTTTTLVPSDGLTAADRTMVEMTTIGGDISPKSVVSSGHGVFLAQNMMYRHTITVYDRDQQLVATIDDTVRPSDFGLPGYEGKYRGSPVEAAFSSDGSYAYVSNYEMYGDGLRGGAGDGCGRGGWPDSLVYRIDTSTLEIDQLIEVGPVPKFLAVSPDDRWLVVANWCGFDVSLVDLATGLEVERVEVGRHPRGVAISGDSSVAYVTVMGSTKIAMIGLGDLALLGYLEGVGRNPRHLVLDPDGEHLYVSLNGEGRIGKLSLEDGEVVATVKTGAAPRSMAISDDGTALYVVNYNSNTVSKVRTADMVELEEHRTGLRPIGITYDAATREIWVSNYSGTIQVFSDRAP